MESTKTHIQFYSKGEDGRGKEIEVEVTVPLAQVVLGNIIGDKYLVTVSSISWVVTKEVYDKIFKLLKIPKIIK